MRRVTALSAMLLALLLIAAPAFASGGGEEETTSDAPQQAASGGMYGEAPMLAEMVAAGELPPVDDRLPNEPKVVEMIEGVGKYGGELVTFATNENIFNQDLQGMWGTSFFRNPRSGVGVEMDIARDYEVNAEKTAVTIYLREGMKWSDGEPFTSEDVRFAFEDMHFNPSVTTWGAYGLDAVEVIDDYTVRLINNEGLGTNLLQMSTWFGGYATSFHPAHYLKKWHLDYNEDAQALAEEEGFDNWYDAMRSHYWWAPLEDTDKPQVEPWQLTQYSTTLKVAERNPYFHRVDTAGNQLPYIDRVLYQIVDPEVYQLRVTGGEASIAYYHLSLENMALYRQNEDAGDYRIILHPGIDATHVKVHINQTHPDPNIRATLNDMRFKQALSVAINREEVQEVIYQGQGRIGAVSPLESVSFYVDGWRDYYTQYDPDMANELLDEMGMDQRDGEGFRLTPSGDRFSFVIDLTDPKYSAELELYTEYFREIGIRASFRIVDDALVDERIEVGDYIAWVNPNPNQPWAAERQLFQATWVWHGSNNWRIWQNYMGELETALTDSLADGETLPDGWRSMDPPNGVEIDWERPPQWYVDSLDLAAEWNQTEMGSPEYVEIAKELFDQQVKLLVRIGAVGEIPSVMIAKNGLGNVLPPGWVAGMPLDHEYVQTWMDQLYWK